MSAIAGIWDRRLTLTGTEVESVVPVFPSADWLEREVWDMFGIRFRNHPNHVRILMPEDYPHHPLRKEFPVAGDTVMRD